MDSVYRHIVLCLLTGLATILPIGGTIVLVFFAERSLSPLIPASLYFPGAGLLAVILVLYLLGLTLTTVIGRWSWHFVDRALSKFPGLGMLYSTLKQILGFESGEGALFQRVVLITDDATGGTEMGLVTATEDSGDAMRLIVFVPGSPNPAQGRLLRLPPNRVLATDWTIDKALKSLFSLGKV